jgi:hypothetical protein
MSLGMCGLLCVGVYNLALYNERHPGRLWEKIQVSWRRFKEWAQKK